MHMLVGPIPLPSFSCLNLLYYDVLKLKTSKLSNASAKMERDIRIGMRGMPSSNCNISVIGLFN